MSKSQLYKAVKHIENGTMIPGTIKDKFYTFKGIQKYCGKGKFSKLKGTDVVVLESDVDKNSLFEEDLAKTGFRVKGNVSARYFTRGKASQCGSMMSSGWPLIWRDRHVLLLRREIWNLGKLGHTNPLTPIFFKNQRNGRSFKI